MRLKNYLNNQYIGLVEKKNSPSKSLEKNEEVEKLLSELNRILHTVGKGKGYEFSLVGYKNMKSPSDVIETKEIRKLESLVRKWMVFNEKLEDIKESYLYGK